MSKLRVNTITALNGDAPDIPGFEGGSGSGASAWGSIDGTGALTNGLNVSTTRVSEGVFAVTFSTPLPDANYSVVGSGGANDNILFVSYNHTATGFTFNLVNSGNNSGQDVPGSFAVFATNALPPKGGTGTDAWATCQADGTIDASFNVASVTKSATGTYDVVFTTPMPTANYAIVGGPTESTAATFSSLNITTNGFTCRMRVDGTFEDKAFAFIVHATNATLPQTVTQEQIESAINNPGASAWGYVFWDGTLRGGNNIASTANPGGSSGLYEVTFSTPMPDANYSVVMTTDIEANVTAGDCYTQNKTQTGFQYYTYNYTGSAGQYSTQFAVFATNALPPKGGTGTDSWASVDLTEVNGACNVPASFNVESVTRTAEGKYDVVFTTPMPTANYSVTGSTSETRGSLGYPFGVFGAENKTTTGFTATGCVMNYASGADNYKDFPFDFTVNATNATLPQTVTQEQIDAAINNPGASAWGNVALDGTLNGGLNATVTKTGTGNYVVTFLTPLPNANYSVNATTVYTGQATIGICYIVDQTATGFQIDTYTYTGSAADYEVNFAVFATNALPPKGGTGTDAWATVLADTGAGGTPTPPPAGFNVATVSRTNTGTYQVVFTTPMPTANYAVSASGFQVVYTQNYTTTGFEVITADTTGTTTNADFAFSVNATNATLPSTITDAQAQKFLTFVNSGGLPPAAFLTDQNPSGTDGGSSVAGWQTRTLNTESDTDSIVTLTNNEFTLAAGTYQIEWSAPLNSGNQHQTKLTNVTDGTTQEMGSSEFSTNGFGGANRSFGSTRVQITSDTTYKIEHYVTSAVGTNGLGFATGNGEPEVYTQVKITGTPL